MTTGSASARFAALPGPAKGLRLAAGVVALCLAVALGLLPIGFWLAPPPSIEPVSVVPIDENDRRGDWWLADLLHGERWFSDSPEEAFRRFRIEIPGPASDGETLFLWIPQFEQRLRVTTQGGHLLHDSTTASGLRGGPIRTASALVPLVPEIVQATDRVINLEVQSARNRIGGLGSVYVAPWRQLAHSIYRQRLLEDTLRPAMLGGLLFLAVMSVGFVLLRRSDAVYYWLAGAMIPYSMVEMGLITAHIPLLSRIDDQFFAVSGIGTLQLIGLLLTFKGRNPSRRAAIGLFLFYLALIVATFLMSNELLVRISIVMVLASIVPVAAFLVLYGFDSAPGRRVSTVALTVALVAFIGGVVHDVLLKLGIHAEGLYVFRYVSFVMLAGIFLVVVKRQTAIADALDESHAHMRRRLAEQETELAEYHRREAEALQLQAAEIERQRITADLHDGMAGHLATIVALSEQEGPENAEISSLAKDALTDLRFVIDATSIASPELRLTLSILRERCLQPLDALGIELGWSTIDLPDDVYLSHEGNLHVLRILQEALNNAVRHGNPAAIHVTGRAVETGKADVMIELVLENRGGRAHETALKPQGHGTTNMTRRAAALHGTIEITPLPDGARMRLLFPTQLARRALPKHVAMG